jgi:hypothetical protein
VGAAALAAAAIVALAMHGRRPDPSLARFEAAGVMLRIAPETVTEVVVSEGERRWRFARAGAGGWDAAPGAPAGGARSAAHVDAGLRFLYASAPQRVLQAEEVAGSAAAEFGLDPPRYSVLVRSSSGAPFAIEFGALNAQGLARYARVAGQREILLLPSFVSEPWEALVAAR